MMVGRGDVNRPRLSSTTWARTGATVFTTLILMTGITAAIPYGLSALAQLKWRWIDQKTMHTPRFARDMIVAVLALVFSILFVVYSRNTGQAFGSTGRRTSWPLARC
jgi:amino acid transporter